MLSYVTESFFLQIFNLTAESRKNGHCTGWRSDITSRASDIFFLLLVTAYKTTTHYSTEVTQAILMFNWKVWSKIPELARCEYIDSEARDRNPEMKQWRADYADKRRGPQENSCSRRSSAGETNNELSNNFEDTPYKVTSKNGRFYNCYCHKWRNENDHNLFSNDWTFW